MNGKKSKLNTESMNSDDFLNHLSDLFATHGAKGDASQRLSNAEHMLQTAAAAHAAHADDVLIAACLLHDIGHWLQSEPVDAMKRSRDDRHEDIGARYLAPHFAAPVTRPIELHVAAKRYLCATEPDYFQKLSPASVRTLEHQGGPMNAAEITDFQSIPDHENAVAIRRWDEYGKVPGLDVPAFDAYRPMLCNLMAAKLEN